MVQPSAVQKHQIETRMTVAAASPTQLECWQVEWKTEPGIIPSSSRAAKADHSSTCFKHMFSPAGVTVTAEKPLQKLSEMAFVNASWCLNVPIRVFSSRVSMKCAERMQHTGPAGESQDQEARMCPSRQATRLTPMASANRHLITTLPHFPSGHLGNTQLSPEHFSFRGAKPNTTPFASHSIPQ